MPSTFLCISVFAIAIAAFATDPLRHLVLNVSSWAKPDASHLFALLCGTALLPVARRVLAKTIGADAKDGADNASLYGLEHGRLHLKRPEALWMNMGYWKCEDEDDDQDSYDDEDKEQAERAQAVCIKPSKTMAEACRDLLVEVLGTAGLQREIASSEACRGMKKSRCVIDLGFGCGDQTTCLMGSLDPQTRWPDSSTFGPCFDYYVGLTLDETQYRFASERIFLSSTKSQVQHRSLAYGKTRIKEVHLFCANAANPESWSAEIKACVQDALKKTQERWVLALDTAYHFSPSRWPIIKHACHSLDASFAAFDLCLSPTASFRERLVLRLLTSLMSAPWTNFITPDEYRAKLIEAGYHDSQITIKDISGDVFGPLAEFLEEQDRTLRVVGLGLGSLNVARLMFRWWARSGVVRGVVVVAKRAHA